MTGCWRGRHLTRQCFKQPWSCIVDDDTSTGYHCLILTLFPALSSRGLTRRPIIITRGGQKPVPAPHYPLLLPVSATPAMSKTTRKPGKLRLSPTRLRLYLTCPKAYHYYYVRGLRWGETSAASSFGSSLHRA